MSVRYGPESDQPRSPEARKRLMLHYVALSPASSHPITGKVLEFENGNRMDKGSYVDVYRHYECPSECLDVFKPQSGGVLYLTAEGMTELDKAREDHFRGPEMSKTTAISAQQEASQGNDDITLPHQDQEVPTLSVSHESHASRGPVVPDPASRMASTTTGNLMAAPLGHSGAVPYPNLGSLTEGPLSTSPPGVYGIDGLLVPDTAVPVPVPVGSGGKPIHVREKHLRPASSRPRPGTS